MIKTCKWCGKEFESKRNTKYCSKECYREGRNKFQRDKFHRRGEPERRICPICGEMFEVGVHNRVYCSNECREENGRRISREYYNRHKKEHMAKVKEWRESHSDLVRGYAKKTSTRSAPRGIDRVPERCRALGQTSCFTCTLPQEECHG